MITSFSTCHFFCSITLCLCATRARMNDKRVTSSPLSNWSTGYPAVCRCSTRYRSHTRHSICFMLFSWLNPLRNSPRCDPFPSQTRQQTDKPSCHLVFSPVPLPLLDLDFKEKMVLEGIIWQELNVLFRRVIFQSEGLDRRGWA